MHWILKYSVRLVLIRNGHVKENREVQIRITTLSGRGIFRQSLRGFRRVRKAIGYQKNIATNDRYRRVPQVISQHLNRNHEKTQASQHCLAYWYCDYSELHLLGPGVLQRRRSQKVLDEQTIYRVASAWNSKPTHRRLLNYH
jgi:hypothetical protein